MGIPIVKIRFKEQDGSKKCVYIRNNNDAYLNPGLMDPCHSTYPLLTQTESIALLLLN